MATEIKRTNEEKIEIIIDDHPEFEGNLKTMILSSSDMCEKVSALFASFFYDYAGCKVRVNDGRANPVVANSIPYGNIYVDLYFKDMGKVPEGCNIIKNITPIGGSSDKKEEKDSLLARYMRVNGARTGRAYNVSDDTFKTLNNLMGLTYNNSRWLERTQEMVTNYSVYSKEEIVVCISGLDLNTILSKIYGVKDEDGRYEYSATPSTVIPSSADEFIMHVAQLNTNIVSELRAKLGIYTANSPSFHSYRR